MKEFKVNEYITLKLENCKTYIYVKGIQFNQCKQLVLNIPIDKISEYDKINSIDEISEKLTNQECRKDIFISPEVEFWGHCSVRHESCMVECGNLRNTKMVSLSMDKRSRSRLRDGRMWLLRHASLVMGMCEALRTMYRHRELPFRYGLAKTPMANDRELAINPVSAQGRKGSDTPAKRYAGSRRCLSITVFLSVVQPGDSECLKELNKVDHTEHGKPDERHISGILTVRKGEGSAGRGTKKKRMPSCNGADRVF